MILSCFTSEWCLFSVTPKQIPVGVLLLAEETNVMVLSQHHTGPDANSLCQSICAELGHWIGIWQATLEAAGRVFLKAGVSPGVTERGQNREQVSLLQRQQHGCVWARVSMCALTCGRWRSGGNAFEFNAEWKRQQLLSETPALCIVVIYCSLEQWSCSGWVGYSSRPHQLLQPSSKLMEASWSYVIGKTTVLILIIN